MSSTHLVAVLVLLGACDDSSTRLMLDLDHDDAIAIDHVEVKVGDRSASSEVVDTIEIVLPDEMAGQPTLVEVWGLSGDQQLVFGSAELTLELGATTSHELWLAALTCVEDPSAPGCQDDDDDDDGDDPPPACTAENDTCEGDTICIDGSCVAAFPRTYKITNVIVEAPLANSEGEAWDPQIGINGPPDMYIGNSTGGRFSDVVDDSYDAAFAGPFFTDIEANETFILHVWDEDVGSPEAVMGCVAAPVTAALLRSRRITCTGNLPTLVADINPE